MIKTLTCTLCRSCLQLQALQDHTFLPGHPDSKSINLNSSIFMDFVFPPCWSPSSQVLAHSPIGRPGSRSWDEDMGIEEHEDNNDHSRHCCPVSPISFLSGRQSYSCCKRQRAFQILITFTFQFKQTVLGISMTSKPHLVVLIIVTSQAVCRPGREWHEEVSHLRQLHLQQH